MKKKGPLPLSFFTTSPDKKFVGKKNDKKTPDFYVFFSYDSIFVYREAALVVSRFLTTEESLKNPTLCMFFLVSFFYTPILYTRLLA